MPPLGDFWITSWSATNKNDLTVTDTVLLAATVVKHAAISPDPDAPGLP
eukprot:XP_001707254.1 Hypothetical protein GL50803_5426 [Giardia lamblia ATCC 50803]